MSTLKSYRGPISGKIYNLAAGERIDPVAEGLGCAGDKSSPKPVVNSRECYNRIFVRLRTPHETLTCRPIKSGTDFAQRASIIENWFNSVFRNGNYVLTFEALQITDEEADAIEKGGVK